MKITQTQYINKPKYTNNIRKESNLSESKNTCDISNGYIQSKNMIFFNGVSDEMYCGGNSTFHSAYFLLSNPVKSNVNIFVQSTVTTNFSPSPISSKIYYCVEDIVGDLESSNNISISNSNSTGSMSSGKIFFGNDLEKIYGIYGKNLIIPPYDMYISNENGSIIISPGFSYLFEITSINHDITSSFIMSFSWWEEPFSNFFD